jgi:hypothetical protein
MPSFYGECRLGNGFIVGKKRKTGQIFPAGIPDGAGASGKPPCFPVSGPGKWLKTKNYGMDPKKNIPAYKENRKKDILYAGYLGYRSRSGRPGRGRVEGLENSRGLLENKGTGRESTAKPGGRRAWC